MKAWAIAILVVLTLLMVGAVIGDFTDAISGKTRSVIVFAAAVGNLIVILSQRRRQDG